MFLLTTIFFMQKAINKLRYMRLRDYIVKSRAVALFGLGFTGRQKACA